MFRKITKKFVIICNIILAILFLIAAFAQHFNPSTYWFFALFGLAFPYFIVFTIFFFIGWVLLKSKWAFLNILLLLVAFGSISQVFGFNFFSKKFELAKKDSSTLRILQWNTASFGEFDKNRIEGSDKRERILEYIKNSNADVLCLQEFFDSFNPKYSENIKYITEQLGYPYFYHAKDYERFAIGKDGKYFKIGYWGNIIFSKHYLQDSGKVDFVKDYTGHNESISFIKILFNNKPIHIFNTHLQSIRLRKTDYEKIREIGEIKNGVLEKSISITKKLVTGYKYRASQAQTVRKVLDSLASNYIITGDFNDVPNSYTYQTISKNLNDAFLQKGAGIGRTYLHLSPTLRIDYVLATKDCMVIQFQKERTDMSDHMPIIVDYKL